MKNIFRTLLLIAVVACAVSVEAAPKKKKSNRYSQDLHFISMWGGAGYSGLVNNFSSATYDAGYSLYGGKVPDYVNTFDPRFVGSAGGNLGFGYELHHKKFIFSVGPEFRFLGSQDKLNFLCNEEYAPDFQQAFNVAQADYATDGMVYRYKFDNYRENQAVGQVMLPIMFGGNFERYYFLAGAKVGYTVFDFWNQRGKLTTSIYDRMAEDPDWQNIMSHNVLTANLADHPVFSLPGKRMNKFGLDATVSAEFGVNLNEFLSAEWNEKNENSAHPWRMRVGAFIDYGVPFMKADGAKTNMFAVAPEGFASNSLMQSSYADKALSSLLVGVKFTALFQLNKPKQPNPRMNLLVTRQTVSKGEFSEKEEIFPAAKINIGVQPKPNQKPRKPQLKTMKKDGTLQPRYAKNTYNINPAPNVLPQAGSLPIYFMDSVFYYNGQLQTEPLAFEHTEDMVNAKDTIRLTLIPAPYWAAFVHDGATEQLMNVTIEFTSQKTGKKLTRSSVSSSKLVYLNDKDVKLLGGYDDKFDIRVTAPDYHDTIVRGTHLYDTLHYALRPVKKIRRTLLLKNMFFATDKTDILQASEDDLTTLYNFLVENPKIRILITGHTDSQGSDTYNQRLSEGRAASVKAEMVRRGIDESRMETDGKGESEPIDTNETEAGRQNNRRVQITVLNAEDATVDVY